MRERENFLTYKLKENQPSLCEVHCCPSPAVQSSLEIATSAKIYLYTRNAKVVCGYELKQNGSITAEKSARHRETGCGLRTRLATHNEDVLCDLNLRLREWME